MAIRAFISCRFPPSQNVKIICELLAPEILPYVSTDVKEGSLPHRLREKIAASECLIAVLTEEGDSAFIQNEVGMAFALGKPVFAVYDDKLDVKGIQPYLSTFIKYRRAKLAHIARDLASLKEAVIEAVTAREISGSPEELLENLRRNGVLGVYPDRATAFRAFQVRWQNEKHIRIVGSSVEGFRRGVGIDAIELLRTKLSDKEAAVRILLTHPAYARYREQQEQERDGYIVDQIRDASNGLRSLRSELRAGHRLQWKFFHGAPTCFMISAGKFMLLNPYLYMQPAYFNFSLLVRDTSNLFDIYSHYSQNHFEKAWRDPKLTTDGTGDPFAEIAGRAARLPPNKVLPQTTPQKPRGPHHGRVEYRR